MGKKQFLGLILMLISGASFAFATIIARLINTTTTITAMTIAVSRFLIAAPLFWLLFPKSPFRIAQTKVRWQFILLGVIFSAASFTSNLALDRISPSIYTIILFTFPSLIVIYSLLAKKAIPRLTPLCLPLSILGLILAVFPFKGGIKVDLQCAPLFEAAFPHAWQFMGLSRGFFRQPYRSSICQFSPAVRCQGMAFTAGLWLAGNHHPNCGCQLWHPFFGCSPGVHDQCHPTGAHCCPLDADFLRSHAPHPIPGSLPGDPQRCSAPDKAKDGYPGCPASPGGR